MKKRLGFVTNSSSSSFIISNQKNFNTLDDVYQVVLNLFKDYRNKIKEMIQYCEERPNFPIGAKDGALYTKDGKYDWEMSNREAAQELYKIIGDEYFSLYYANLSFTDWVEHCPDYQSYYDYWYNKMYVTKEKDTRGFQSHAPFSICDYTKETMDTLHYIPYDFENGECIERDNPTTNVEKDELVDWYFLCCHSNYNNDCKKHGCYYLRNEYMDIDDCAIVRKCKKQGIPMEELQLKVLGRFAILSEGGYIPEPIVDQLSKICKYHCNHMG